MTRRRLWAAGPWIAPLLFACGPAFAAEPPPSTSTAPTDIVSVAIAPPVHSMLLAEWDWNEFLKYWKRQLGKTTGVLGIATVTAIIAALIILSKGRTPGQA